MRSFLARHLPRRAVRPAKKGTISDIGHDHDDQQQPYYSSQKMLSTNSTMNMNNQAAAATLATDIETGGHKVELDAPVVDDIGAAPQTALVSQPQLCKSISISRRVKSKSANLPSTLPSLSNSYLLELTGSSSSACWERLTQIRMVSIEYRQHYFACAAYRYRIPKFHFIFSYKIFLSFVIIFSPLGGVWWV